MEVLLEIGRAAWIPTLAMMMMMMNINSYNNNSEKMFTTFPGGSQVPASSSKRVVKVWLEIEELQINTRSRSDW